MVWGAASNSRMAVETGEGLYLENALDKLRKLFTLWGILTLLGIILGILMIVLMFAGIGMAGAMSGGGGGGFGP